MAGRTGKDTGQSRPAQGKKEQEAHSLPVEFEVRIHSLRPNDSVKANASVNINGAVAIRGIKIVEGSNGLFVAMPSYKAGNEYKDICFPITAECRKQLTEAVLNAYEQAFSQVQENALKSYSMRQAPEGQAMDAAVV